MNTFMSRLRGKLLGLGGGVLLLMAAGVGHAGTVTYVYTDPQGTPLAEANASGTITATFDYAPYGSIALGTVPNGPGYTGHVNDPDTGLVYMQARYYDPSVGRFLSTDPVTPTAGNAFNFSRYAYANNNPVMNMDPDGRLPQWMDQLFPKGDLFRTTGESIAADTAFVVGAATNDRQLQSTAVEGMQEATSGGSGSGAVIALVTMGEGDEGGAEGAAKNLKFDSEKAALHAMLKADKRSGGMTEDDWEAYKELNNGLSNPFEPKSIHGPEKHATGAPSSRQDHVHMGGVDHIPIIETPPSNTPSNAPLIPKGKTYLGVEAPSVNG
jgi:RHS repeat-associated protein